ncbi:MAG: hypothetical protein KJ804_00170 [Proteobacteria bacterium]|nr:hypothetical protein [Pseudomonadota bacterium]MBU1056721.1 hypothetical protein [Pseudomonadota bacterium]
MNLKRRIGALVLAIWLIAAGAEGAEPLAGFVMVVNVQNEISTISRKEVELIFLNKKRSWPDGTKISVLINENLTVADSFCQTALKRSAHQFLIFRKKMLFRGQGMPPPTLNTDKEVIAFVVGHSGSISYVSPEAVTPAVKVVPITQ